MAEDDFMIFTLLFVFGALSLALIAATQTATSYYQAYLDAPKELISFLDAVDFSIQENESYEFDVAKVQSLEDKLRLNKLIREIQRGSDDLREALNACVMDKAVAKLKSGVRLYWAGKKKVLEEKMRRLDMLRLRFLVVYMGIVAARTPQISIPAVLHTPPLSPLGDSEKRTLNVPKRPNLPHGLTEAITSRGSDRAPPPRRFSTQAMGHNDNVGDGQKTGWAGVIQELQRSPKMHKRHASVEADKEVHRH